MDRRKIRRAPYAQSAILQCHRAVIFLKLNRHKAKIESRQLVEQIALSRSLYEFKRNSEKNKIIRRERKFLLWGKAGN